MTWLVIKGRKEVWTKGLQTKLANVTAGEETIQGSRVQLFWSHMQRKKTIIPCCLCCDLNYEKG